MIHLRKSYQHLILTGTFSLQSTEDQLLLMTYKDGNRSLTIYFNQGEMSVPLSGDQQVILANGIEGIGLKKVLQAGGVALVEGV